MNDFSLIYWCMCDEIGKEGTYHTHIFFVAKSGVMFDTVQNRLYGAHIEKALGTYEDNYNYIRKLGVKYEDKKETNLPDTFEEFGTLPADRKASSSLSEDIYEMIVQGCSDSEIINTYPVAMKQIEHIRKTREIINAEKYKNTFRKLYVCYISGKTGSGKTRTVMEKYGYPNVFRVTDYDHPFDGYQGQDVILFEEFRSSLKIADMLIYLDGYPVELPCRYSNKQAQYTKVYICSNIPIEKQYINIQHEEQETYKAFMRRINDIIELL